MSAVPEASSWHAGFLQLLPAVQTHAQIQFRALPPVHREEAIQEAVAFACVNYRLLAAQGKLHVVRPGTLATFAVNRARGGRHVGGRQETAKDPLSQRCQQLHGVNVRSLNGLCRLSVASDWRQLVIADRNAPIPDTAAFRIDFAEFLRRLPRRDRRIIRALIAGEQAFAVAQRYGLSAGRISQLRRRYERDWQLFQGEPLARHRAA
jgi:hypothetical protein